LADDSGDDADDDGKGGGGGGGDGARNRSGRKSRAWGNTPGSRWGKMWLIPTYDPAGTTK